LGLWTGRSRAEVSRSSSATGLKLSRSAGQRCLTRDFGITRQHEVSRSLAGLRGPLLGVLFGPPRSSRFLARASGNSCSRPPWTAPVRDRMGPLPPWFWACPWLLLRRGGPETSLHRPRGMGTCTSLLGEVASYYPDVARMEDPIIPTDPGGDSLRSGTVKPPSRSKGARGHDSLEASRSYWIGAPSSRRSLTPWVEALYSPLLPDHTGHEVEDLPSGRGYSSQRSLTPWVEALYSPLLPDHTGHEVEDLWYLSLLTE
jgi:hypothetical protein